MKKLILLGSGEFTDAMNEIDAFLIQELKKDAPSPVVAILPTAAGLENTIDYWIGLGTKHFDNLGIKSRGIRILNHGEADNESLVGQLSGVNWIYFSGGNPGHLLRSLKSSILLKKINDMFRDGVLLTGCSAGAMVLGKYVYTNPYEVEEGHEEPKYEEGFNLVPYTILPHFDYVLEHKMLNKMIENVDAKIFKTLVGIDENTAMVFDRDKSYVVGEGYARFIGGEDVAIYKNQSVPQLFDKI